MTNIQFVLSEDINQEVERHLRSYRTASRAQCVLLLAKTGHLITQEGFTSSFNVQSIAALIGGIFSSTQALAKLVGEDKFKVMFQEGKHWNVYFCLVAEHFILATVFDKSTVVGMIRNYSDEAEKNLEAPLARAVVSDTAEASQAFSQRMAAARPAPQPGREQEQAPAAGAKEEAMPDFNQAVEDALSKLFS